MLEFSFSLGVVLYLLSGGSCECFEVMLLCCGSSFYIRWSRAGFYSIDLAIEETRELLRELVEGNLCYNGSVL